MHEISSAMKSSWKPCMYSEKVGIKHCIATHYKDCSQYTALALSSRNIKITMQGLNSVYLWISKSLVTIVNSIIIEEKEEKMKALQN